VHRPSELVFYGSPSLLPSVVSLNLPPSKSQLIRRIFIGAVQGLDHPMIEWNPTWPKDVMEAWSLVNCALSRRQQGHHQSVDHMWEAGEAGAVMRFGLAFLVAQGCGGILRGNGRAHERPIGDLVNALILCGANIEYLGEAGYPPLKIHSSSLRRRDLFMEAGTSSQFISAMAMVAPLLRPLDAPQENVPWEIAWSPQSFVSRPYLALTVQEMSGFGYSFEYSEHSLRYFPAVGVQVQTLLPGYGALKQDSRPVEGDWSAASFWIWRHAVIPLCQRLELKILTSESNQADSVVLDLLARLAPQVSAVFNPDTCTWTFDSLGSSAMLTNNSEERPPDRGQPVLNCDQGLWRIKATDFPDMVPALAVWAILSGNAVEITGIEQLRYKESDRIQALMVNLELLGVPHEMHVPDGLLIRPLASWAVYSRRFIAPPFLKGHSVATGPLLRCFGDHRLAMAFSMLALPDFPILLDEPHTVRKSYPGFWEDWTKFEYVLKALN